MAVVCEVGTLVVVFAGNERSVVEIVALFETLVNGTVIAQPPTP
jgi:hypothetical protein